MGSLIKAKYIYPIEGPLIKDGALFIEDSKIQWMGDAADFVRFDQVDCTLEYRDHVIFPGLINLHCHLGLTGLLGKIPSTDSFSEWAINIVSILSDSPLPSQNAQNPSRAGAIQLLVNSGCTTVVDHTTSFQSLPSFSNPSNESILRIISCLEFGGILKGLDDDCVFKMVDEYVDVCVRNGVPPALAPHAPYSVNPSLFDKLFDSLFASKIKLWSIHLSESGEEEDYFSRRRGKMWDWLQSKAKNPVWPRASSAFAHTFGEQYPTGKILLIHGNFLSENELKIANKMNWSLVHCPRSHDFFGHTGFPVPAMERLKCNWGLGTDSLATVKVIDGEREPELDLFAEAKALLSRKEIHLSHEFLLKKMTIEAARMIGLESEIGTLAPGKMADFNVLSLNSEWNHGQPIIEDDLARHIFQNSSGRLATYIGGQKVESKT